MSDIDPARLMRFILELRQTGITDARALSALERTPRTHYAPEHLEGLALDDIALPLAHAQAMTKPSTIARIIAALEPQESDVVLEVGTGSGYQAAAIATMARKVVTVDRWRDLVADARVHFGTARLDRVHAHVADGFEGWEEGAPYDRIVVNVAMADFPLPLLDQLKPGGTLLAPLGDAENQRLIRYRNARREDLGAVKFPPLERGLGDDPPPAP
ncbi:protein-L-isoaspartate(D-aspartate) O-methyltransferase [Terricaulis sp.]|uniref:protein-L-isoaspartate(D-aspartate) O-methyltransferase n=1 Tax=Terricaulis sp. TaxID=2768686 RepID=UPI003782EFB9